MRTFGSSMSPGQIAKSAVLVAVLIAIVIVIWPSSGDPNSPDPDQRLKAIAALGERADAESIETLVDLAADPEPNVATAAVKAIGMFPKLSPAPLRKILASPDISPPARGEAAAALGKCPKASVEVAVLTEILTSKTEDPQVRAGAARGLARRRDNMALKELVEALEDPDPRVRLWAITAIGRSTAFRFKFDAWAPPAKQQNEIRFIKETLRKRTSYK